MSRRSFHFFSFWRRRTRETATILGFMTDRERLVKVRLGILAMARELRNVAKTCKLFGLSRSQFYAMKKAFETEGEAGLFPRLRRKPKMPNRTPESLESQILLKTQEIPSVSYLRVADRMKKEGMGVTPAMVRYVWGRHGLSTQSARLQWVRKRRSSAETKPKVERQAECAGHSN